LLAYQISKDNKSDPIELAQEWYAVESEKFWKKPASTSYDHPVESRHPLREAWENDLESDENATER
jgi:hypothetical protein